MSEIAPEKNSQKRIAELSIATPNDIQEIDKCNRKMLKENYDQAFYEAIFRSQLSCSFVLRVEQEKPNIAVTEQSTPSIEVATPAVSTPTSEQAVVEKSEESVKVSQKPLENAQLAGYVLATLNCDKKGQTNCHIISLAVYPEFQRRGFAHVLMQSVEVFVKERYPSTHHLVLHVRKHNKAAYNLYCKLQYGRTKVVKGYYTTPKEDAYEMKKYLEPKEQPPPQQEEKE